ncbi:hypothetical protein AM588_10001089 [Phytophthora nicotianae]|uniref:Uncharacterized protein n=1 Tax=Phytophthora nicotianae TaxID=4792 RepID=A0A0W8CPX1_PHYNI|nr:hypothetical protein AM588_10001089 [Phytophthora nicotianae]
MLTRFALRPAGRTALRSSFCRGLAASSGTDDGIKTGRRWTDLFTTTEPAKLVKRKVAIVTGYMGTGYHGLQLNDNVKTIEDDVRQAIFDAGAMRESNFVDLGKIDWARSSRTDKGVHAGCIVFSGKLLIDEENKMDPVSGRVYGLKEALNASLPDNIRVFSCTRVSKRFSARKNCVLREYEYFMPLSFLKDSLVGSDGEDFDTDEAVAEFCRALRRYEGVHDFHNFTRSRSYFYKMQAKRKHYRANYQRNAAEDESDDVDAEDVEDESAEVDSVVDDYSEESSQFEDEEELTRKLLLRHRRSIYSCSGTLVPDFCGEPHLRVHIVGQAFLLNQIRCMVGGALAVATKGMSRVEFDAALLTNRIVRVPIAPAEGLVLLSSSFGGKSHTVSLYEDPNTELAKERKDVVHRVLLNRKEDEEMRQFREEVIYKEISRSWDMEEKMDRWRAYLERCYEANERLNQDELSAVLYEMDQAKLATKNKNQAHVEQNRFELTEYGRKSVGALLPKQFATKLCVRYSVAPGIFTSDLRRAVTRFGFGGDGNPFGVQFNFGDFPQRFDEHYRVYPVSFCDKAHLEDGDKILLPPSALETLGVPTMKAEDVKPPRLGGTGFGSGLRLKKSGEKSSTDADALRAARLRKYEAFHGTGHSLSGKTSTFSGATAGGTRLGGSSNGGYSLNGSSSASNSNDTTAKAKQSVGHRLNGEAVGASDDEEMKDEEMKENEEHKGVVPFQGEGRRLR